MKPVTVLRILIVLTAVIQTCFCPDVSAQSPVDKGVRFDRAVFDTGAQNTTGAFIQDQDGFLWLGTNGAGLVRYDGYELKVYKFGGPKSLPDPYVYALYEDREGLIWIGTAGSGLVKYDKQTDTFTQYRHDPNDPTTIGGDAWKLGSDAGIVEDQDGILWIANSGGLSALDKQTGRFTRYQHDPQDPRSLSDNDARTLLIDQAGVLWVGVADGLNRLDKQTGAFTRYVHDPNDPQSFGGVVVNSIAEDRDGLLWLATQESGLFSFDPHTETFTQYAHDPDDPNSPNSDVLRRVYDDSAGRIWIVYMNIKQMGVSAFDKRTQTFTHYTHDPDDPYSLSSAMICYVYEDRAGILWMVNDVGVVDKLDSRKPTFKLYRANPDDPDSLDSDVIVPVYEDRQGILWIGTDKGLNSYDKRTGIFSHHLSGYYPGIYEDSAGTFWLGSTSPGVLSIFDRATGQIVKSYVHDPDNPDSLAPTQQVNMIAEDRTDPNVLWIATYDVGVERFDKQTETFTHYPSNPDDPNSLSNNSLFSFYQDGEGILWFPTFGGGLSRLDPRTNTFTRYTHDPKDPTTISADSAIVVFEDSTGTLWVGTAVGLDKLDRATGTFTHYTEETGFPISSICGIAEDEDGNLWMGSMDGGGLIKFNPHTETVKVYKTSDGLQGDAFFALNGIVDRDGEMWFGGPKGLNSFYPREIVDNSYIPPVVVTALKQGGEDMSPGQSPERVQEIVLDWRHDYFEFEYAALNFTRAEKNQYKYVLEGLDKEWFNAGTQRFGRYSGLPGGTYTLRILGSNNDGVWNEQGVSIRVHVKPPFWQTWWAYTIMALLGVGAVLGLMRYQTRAQTQKLAQREKELAQERRVTERLQQLDRLKDEFLANTSHELRTPLQGIIGLSESLIDGIAGELPDRAKSNLRMIVSSGKRLSGLVNDILDYAKLKYKDIELKLHPVDLRTEAEVVLTMSRPLLGNKDVHLVNAIPDTLPLAWADEDRVQQILYNLVGNAIKFTERGAVTVSGTAPEVEPGQAGQLTISISDTGIGIPKDRLERIFESFEQGDGSIERQYGGTGLGLTLTRHLVELHGGAIWVESIVGQGTTFHFTLPISTVSEKPAELAALPPALAPLSAFEESPIMPQSTPAAGPAAPTVLVVDDELVNLQVISNYLTLRNYQVNPYTSGEEALTQIQRQDRKPDLVLLDVMMPRLSGYEVCRKIREQYPASELPILFLTARSQVQDLVAGFEAGANDYLIKPVKRDELLARSRTLIQLKEAQEALKESELRYRALFDNAPVGISLSTWMGQLLACNSALLNIVGYSDAEIRLIDTRDLYPDPQERARLLEQLRRDGLVHGFETEMVRKDGSHFLASLTVTSVLLGNVETLLTVVLDITARKQAEEEMRRLNAELEQRVIERASQLEAANQELEAFSYSVSHDLRAPIRAMTGYARIISEEFSTDFPPAVKEYLAKISDSGNKMAQLIDGLLAFSRLGRGQLSKREVDLNALTRTVIESLAPEIGSRQIEWTLADLPLAQADPTLIQQVFANLIGNAVKYSRKRNPARIEVGYLEKAGETIYFVRDNGAGFDMKYTDKLFGVFQRLHREDEFEGTGIGLATAQRIIHRHGGRIWAEAEPDKGSTFYFTLGSL